MIKTACAYVRVSTDKQEELSPDSQIREIKEYAARNNMLISKIYVEEHGISGKNASKRPAFQEMMRMIEQGEANCVIVKDLIHMMLCWYGNSHDSPATLTNRPITNQSCARNAM